MRDHVVLWMAYRDDDGSPARFERLARHEPGAIPVDVSGRPGGLDLGPYRDEGRWHGCDAWLYVWARSAARVPARRYVVVESDTWCDLGVRDFWGERYDAPAAFPIVWTPAADPEYLWWCELGKLPPAIRPHATAVAPIGCALLSAAALDALADAPPPPGVFCEVRLGSWLAARGVPPVAHPVHPGNVSLGDPVEPDGPGWFHPVKHRR